MPEDDKVLIYILFKSLVAVFAPITYQLEEKYKGE
jgi:hypothetical protein